MKEGWTYKKLGEVANVTDYVANGSFATLRENVHYLDKAGFAILVRLADYTNNFDSTRFVYIDEHAYNFLSKSKLYGGEIIMSNVGSIGKSFICPILSMPMSLAPNSIVINTPNNEFYFYFFNSPSFQNSLKTISSKTALPKFNKTQFKTLIAPIPPLAEQERIVAELDLLSSIIDKKKAQLKELDQLAQSIFYDMFGDPITNEKGWEVKKLGECFSIGAGGTPSKKVANYWDNGEIPWIGSNMCQNCIIKETDGKYITEEGLNHSSAKMLEAGTVLVALVGATIGKVALLKTETTTNQNIAHIKVNESRDFLSEYVFYHIMNQYDEFLNIGNGDFKMANQAFIKSLSICIPPLSLQQEFAEKVEAIERQKTLIQQSIDEVQTLFDSRMDYWFD